MLIYTDTLWLDMQITVKQFRIANYACVEFCVLFLFIYNEVLISMLLKIAYIVNWLFSIGAVSRVFRQRKYIWLYGISILLINNLCMLHIFNCLIVF